MLLALEAYAVFESPYLGAVLFAVERAETAASDSHGTAPWTVVGDAALLAGQADSPAVKIKLLGGLQLVVAALVVSVDTFCTLIDGRRGGHHMNVQQVSSQTDCGG